VFGGWIICPAHHQDSRSWNEPRWNRSLNKVDEYTAGHRQQYMRRRFWAFPLPSSYHERPTELWVETRYAWTLKREDWCWSKVKLVEGRAGLAPSLIKKLEIAYHRSRRLPLSVTCTRCTRQHKCWKPRYSRNISQLCQHSKAPWFEEQSFHQESILVGWGIHRHADFVRITSWEVS